MFRRRIPRNPNRPGVLGRQALVEANRLFAQGQYQEAAPIFERVAQGAERHGLLARVPNLYLQAARCRYLAGNPEVGRSHLKRALDQLAADNLWIRLKKMGTSAVAELRQYGFNDDAAEIEIWLAKILPESSASRSTAPEFGPAFSQQAKRLPARCPSCGAGLRPDEIEWLDTYTVECPYCGSPVQTEK